MILGLSKYLGDLYLEGSRGALEIGSGGEGNSETAEIDGSGAEIK